MGLIAFQEQEYEKSVALLTKFIGNRSPRRTHVAHAYFCLGSSLLLLQRYQASIDVFTELLKINPGHVQGLNNLGMSYGAVGRTKEAIECFAKAISLAPDNVNTLCNMGNSFYFMQQVDKAIVAYRKALMVQPDCIDALKCLGVAFQAKGLFADAAHCYLRTLAIRPDDARAFRGYADSRKVTDNDLEFVSQFENLANSSMQPVEDIDNSSELLFALGKCHDDLGNYDRAFLYFGRANRIEKTQFPFDRQQHEAIVSEIIGFFSKDYFAKSGAPWNAEEAPIFIVGMPRSGTTLIDQIISSHSNVSSIHESGFWGRQYAGLSPFDAKDLDEQKIRALATEYMNVLRGRYPRAKHVIDKMPQNFFHLGLIRTCFPSARIIHCLRNPIDTCLSIFFQKFVVTHAYGHDFQDLAFYYGQYERIMKHWTDVLPGDMLEVQYEDLVANQEETTKRLLQFCNLEWEDACLDFQNNDRAVYSASSWQVRQPLYSSSVGRWKNYRQYLGALTGLMEDGQFGSDLSDVPNESTVRAL